MIDRSGVGEAVGAGLLLFTGMTFGGWDRHRSGTIHRQTPRGYVAELRLVARSLPESGRVCDCSSTARGCGKLPAVKEAIWTFATAERWPRTTTRPSVPRGTGGSGERTAE